MNQARALHEATQLALKGRKVLVLCPGLGCGRELSDTLIESVAHVSLLYTEPKRCTHEPNGPGWAVRFRDQGEVFFTFGFSKEDRYFEYLLELRSVDEIRKENRDKGLYLDNIPLEWNPATSLIRELVHVPSRYERIQAKLGPLWDTSR
jgi:hypothetical protein